MDPIDQLLTIAEIALTLAGFAGIIATFQFQNGSSLSRGRVLSLALIVYISLVGTFFAVLPIVLLNFGLPEKSVWAGCSALMAINISAFIVYIWRRTDTNHLSGPIRSFYGASFLLASAVVIANIMNCIPGLFDGEYSIYFVNFVFFLFLVGFYFSRLLLHPLWKAVDKQTTDISNDSK